jgi:hypothetical protein
MTTKIYDIILKFYRIPKYVVNRHRVPPNSLSRNISIATRRVRAYYHYDNYVCGLCSMTGRQKFKRSIGLCIVVRTEGQLYYNSIKYNHVIIVYNNNIDVKFNLYATIIFIIGI